MSNAEAFKTILFWAIVIAAGWWYFGMYKPSHPPKPSVEDISRENDRAYKEAHPEEDEDLAILSAKYDVGIKSVQIITQIDNSLDSIKQKNKQDLIVDIAEKSGIPKQTVAAILIDYSYLTSDCSQPT